MTEDEHMHDPKAELGARILALESHLRELAECLEPSLEHDKSRHKKLATVVKKITGREIKIPVDDDPRGH